MLKNIAIFSPNLNAYSETFITAHKEQLKGNIHFLYGDYTPTYSEKHGSLFQYFKKNHFAFKLLKLLPVFLYNRIVKISNSDLLKFYLKNERIDIVLAEYGMSGSNNLEILKELHIPFIVHFHGYDASVNHIIENNKVAYINMFQYAKAVIVVSNAMKSKIIEIGCTKDKVTVNPCAPNKIFFDCTPTFLNKQFIAIGRFVDKKAPYYTILAFNKVLNKHPDAKLFLAGHGPLLETCKNIVDGLNLSESIVFLDVITPTMFLKYLSESLAFVQHSITALNGDMEGTPVAVLEASAAGLPVISTYHAGIPDVIINNVTGLLVEEHDVDGMAINMIKLMDDVALAKSLGAAGKKYIIENYTMQRHISVIQDLIDK